MATASRVSRRSRRLLVAGGVTLALLVAFSVPWKLNFLRDDIARRVEAATGRAFAIEGDLWWRWSGRLTAEGLTFANPSWAGRPQMFTARKVDARLAWGPLLRERRLVLPRVVVDRPDLWLETTADGRFNARFDRQQKDGSSGVTLGEVQLDAGVLHFVEPHEQTAVRVAFDNRRAADGAQPRLTARADGRWRGLALQAEGSGDPVLRLRDVSRPYALDVAGRIGETRIEGRGQVTGLVRPTAADLALRVEGRSLGEWYRILGVGLPNSPPYRTHGRVRLADGVWHYEKFASRVGRSDLGGDLRFEPRPARPFIAGTLVSQRLDLNDFALLIGKRAPTKAESPPPGDAGRADRPRATAAPDSTLLPQWSFSADKWDTLDADIRFDGRSIVNVGKWPFDHLKMHVTLDARRLTLDPVSFGFADGTLAGALRIDGNARPMAARLAMSGRGLALDELLPVVNNERLALGKVNAKVQLAGRGDSFGRMLATADGEVQMAMGRGQVSNLLLELIDLDAQEALGFLIRGDRPVAVRCALVDAAFEDGVLKTRNAVFDTNDTIIEVSGTASFARERLDLRVKPVAKDVSLLTLRVPFDVGGTFRDPQVSPDRARLVLRAGGALLLGSITPLAALIPLIETGPGEDADCTALVARAKSEGVPVKDQVAANAPAARGR